MRKFLTATTTALFMLGTAASAAVLTINTALPIDSIPGTFTHPEAGSPENDALGSVGDPGPLSALGFGASVQGFFNSYITLDEDTRLVVDFFGAEAGATNEFLMGGNSFTHTQAGPDQKFGNIINDGLPLDTFVVGGTAGTLDFEFTSSFVASATSTITGSVANGDPNVVDQGPNFFATFGPVNETASSGTVLWLFFDDAGTAGDNHDDMVVRISIAPVPLPATVFMLLAAVGGLGAAGRRRKAA